VLNVAARPDQQFTEEELRFLETLGHQICLAVERARHRAAQAAAAEEARRAYQELKDAQERLVRKEKMAVLGTFASGLAHEVRNPLNSIALQTSVLERRIARLPEAETVREMRELTESIREEIRRLDGLVGDFLLFARADRVLHRPGSLDPLVDEVMRLLDHEAGAAGVTLRRRSIGQPVPVFAMDAEKMKQVVINLVRNAIEATPAGGTVTVESGLVDGKARLTVRDTGPGLPPGVDVFQLFVTTKPKGTGLGLSIVQQIVAQHGGEISGTSLPEGGACFSVLLPAPAAAKEG
jgi:signal transduction histidine kinase